MASTVSTESVGIPIAGGRIEADVRVPTDAAGVVLFAHGSGSSRFSRRNRAVAEFLHTRGFATVLLDLLTREEDAIDARTREYRFDIELLAERVGRATDWLRDRQDLGAVPVGYFGASTGAAAALIAAGKQPSVVRAVVSRGGRPDLAAGALASVRAPTLLIVGGDDEPVIGMNRDAMARMTTKVHLAIVPGATHLFEEPGTLEQVMALAANWFRTHLANGERPS